MEHRHHISELCARWAESVGIRRSGARGAGCRGGAYPITICCGTHLFLSGPTHPTKASASDCKPRRESVSLLRSTTLLLLSFSKPSRWSRWLPILSLTWLKFLSRSIQVLQAHSPRSSDRSCDLLIAFCAALLCYWFLLFSIWVVLIVVVSYFLLMSLGFRLDFIFQDPNSESMVCSVVPCLLSYAICPGVS